MTEQERTGVDRRTLIKRGVAATGAAYIAPQVLHMSVAGAQTTTCHAVKYEPNCNALGPNLDPSCDAAFNNAIAAALGGNANAGCPAPLTVNGVGTNNATVSVTRADCTLSFVGFKAAQTCSYTGGVTIAGDGKSATIASPDNAISHITVVVCCTSSRP